jgi:Na+-driven multidrug efflux pump
MFSMWTFRVALSYLFAPESTDILGLFSLPGLGMGVMGVWVAMTVDWAFRAALFLWRFLRGTWLNVKKHI